MCDSSRNELARCVAMATILVMALGMQACEPIEVVDAVELVSRVACDYTRDEALQAYSDAWFHSYWEWEGPKQKWATDIFFYGPRNRTELTIVTVEYWWQEGAYRVHRCGTIDGLDMLDATYGDWGIGPEPPFDTAFDDEAHR